MAPASATADVFNAIAEAHRREILDVHWDDFFRSLDKPLAPMPYAFDAFPKAMTQILRRGNRDGVEVQLPVLMRPAAPLSPRRPPTS